MRDRINTLYDSDTLPPSPADGDVVELPLLLHGWQVSALETAAHDRGLTAGQMVRSLLQSFLFQTRSDHAPEAASVSAAAGRAACGVP